MLKLVDVLAAVVVVSWLGGRRLLLCLVFAIVGVGGRVLALLPVEKEKLRH